VEGEVMSAIDPKDLHEMAEGNLSNYVRDHIHAAADEIEALRKDAERYRWLRDEAFQATAARIVQMLPGHMDAEIDAAMKGANA
jgi:hypothetical protein